MEMLKFKCSSCDALFEAVGTKKEWISPIYGNCWKYVADSPCCNLESDEHKEPKPQKATSSSRPASCGSCCACDN